MHKKPVKDIKKTNNEGRFLGMVTIPYCKGLSEKFRRMCYRYKVKTVFKKKCTLVGLFEKNKTQVRDVAEI
jgi:hypothetical protein